MTSINKRIIQYVVIGASVGSLAAILLVMYSVSMNKPIEEPGKNGTNIAEIRTKPLKFAFFTLSEDPEARQILSEHLSNGKDDSNYVVQSLRTLVDTTAWFDVLPNEKKIILAQSLENMTSAIQFAKRHSETDPIIVYDIEHWPKTPAEERNNPVHSMRKGEIIVHKAGFKYGVVPDADYLLKRYKEINWAKIDFVDMQLQRYSKDPEKFATHAAQIGSYIKSKNPQIELFVQISLGRTDYHQSTNLLKHVSDTIDGIFIAYIPESRLAGDKYSSQQTAEKTLDLVLDEIKQIKGNKTTSGN